MHRANQRNTTRMHLAPWEAWERHTVRRNLEASAASLRQCKSIAEFVIAHDIVVNDVMECAFVVCQEPKEMDALKLCCHGMRFCRENACVANMIGVELFEMNTFWETLTRMSREGSLFAEPS